MELEQIIAQVMEEASRALDMQNFFTEKKHRQTVLAWNSIVKGSNPQLRDEDLWKTAVVKGNARYYLRMRVSSKHLFVSGYCTNIVSTGETHAG